MDAGIARLIRVAHPNLDVIQVSLHGAAKRQADGVAVPFGVRTAKRRADLDKVDHIRGLDENTVPLIGMPLQTNGQTNVDQIRSDSL